MQIHDFKGKVVGLNWYIHISALRRTYWSLQHRVLSSKIFEHTKCDILKFKFNRNNTMQSVSYLCVDGWNTCDEPILTRSITEYPLGDIKVFKYNSNNRPIYHHKWMMIPRDLADFDYDKSVARSGIFDHPVMIAHAGEDKHFKSKIGQELFWNRLIQEVEEYDENRIDMQNRS